MPVAPVTLPDMKTCTNDFFHNCHQFIVMTMIIIIIIIIANNIYRKQTQKAANVQRGQSINNVLHVFQNIQ